MNKIVVIMYTTYILLIKTIQMAATVCKNRQFPAKYNWKEL